MSPARSLTRIPVKVWIPPIYDALYKIEITRSDSTVDDITDEIYQGEFVDGVTSTIGSFTFLVDNSDESKTGIWSGNEVIKIYLDYATSSTSLRFRGRIEKVSYKDNKIQITGRSESAKLLDITVTKNYDGSEASEILIDLFDTYATDFTYTNVNTTGTNVTANWYQKPFWECVQELCHASGFDCYVDSSLDCHFFESGSVVNQVEAVIHESNIIEVSDFAEDLSLLKNRIIVYGAEVEGLPLIATAEDASSQNSYGIKELIIQDSNVITVTQAQAKADFELDRSKDPPVVGEVICKGLATIQPGEKIYISDPANKLPPTAYKILSYRHAFEGFHTTTLTIEKEPKNIYHIFRDRITKEQELTELPNPNEMRFSWNFDFQKDRGSHTGTEITESRLKTDGGASGTWVSDQNVISNEATSAELRVNGEALPGTAYYFSVDGGASWSPFLLNTPYVLSPSGKFLRIKVELNSASTQIDSLALLYK